DYCGYQSQVTLKARTGREYYIRISGYDNEQGNYILFVDRLDHITADFNDSGYVDLLDFAIFSATWLAVPGDTHWNGDCNLYGDSVIDIPDLAILAENWLAGTAP
ncbi:MAG: hypothetical protein KAT56_05835, partial [Sedimentisphaerales bacterium]|nr:hypothetical protein [Sedimentisphaerales bacterium]